MVWPGGRGFLSSRSQLDTYAAFREIIHPADRDYVESVVKNEMRQVNRFESQFRILLPNDSEAGPNSAPGPGPSRGATASGAAAATKKRRYLDIEKEFKTRGFYMEVEMDHRKLPEFLVMLSNSPWPLCITREFSRSDWNIRTRTS